MTARITIEELQPLIERVRDATRINFPLACADLFAYLDARIPDNATLLVLNADRQTKWSEFPGRRPAAWAMPSVKRERESLAYDLFRSVSERGEDGRALLFHMYRKNFDENVDCFRADFLQHFADALTHIGQSEPTTVGAGAGREKQQKFGILDAPNLLASDLERAPGLFGRAVVYFDLDNFKAINSSLSERLVDETVLPSIQRLVAAAVLNQGYAYAEGGDEMIVLLPNSTLSMGAAFAESLRLALARQVIDAKGLKLSVTASFGVAAGFEGKSLADAANLAKNFSKAQGKNCVAVSQGEKFEVWASSLQSSDSQ